MARHAELAGGWGPLWGKNCPGPSTPRSKSRAVRSAARRMGTTGPGRAGGTRGELRAGAAVAEHALRLVRAEVHRPVAGGGAAEGC